MRRIGRLILVSVLLGGSLGLAPQALASSGMTGGPATVAPAAGTKVTLQGRLEVLEGDDFVHGRTIETYELVTAQGSYELRFGQAGPEVPPAGSTVTVQGTLNGSAITVNDPLAGKTAFPGKIIPASRINPVLPRRSPAPSAWRSSSSTSRTTRVSRSRPPSPQGSHSPIQLPSPRSIPRTHGAS